MVHRTEEARSTDLWFRSDMVLPGQIVAVYQRKRGFEREAGWSRKYQGRDGVGSRMETGLMAEGTAPGIKPFLPISERMSFAGWI